MQTKHKMITSIGICNGVKNMEKNMSLCQFNNFLVHGQTIVKNIEGDVELVFLPLSLSVFAFLSESVGLLI